MIINPSTFTSAIPVSPSDTINIPGPILRFKGETTSVVITPGRGEGILKDATFFKDGFVTNYNPDGSISHMGVSRGMVVYNMYSTISSSNNAPLQATILEVIDKNTLLLSEDIFPEAGGVAVQAYNIYDANEVSPPGAQLYVGTAGDVYVETINGDLVFIEDVPAGDILPVVIQKVLVGAAAAGGQPNTLTTAGKLTAFI